MSRHAKRAIAMSTPLFALACAALVAVIGSNRSPSRRQLASAWLPPSAANPFGTGEAGIDLLAFVTHATTRVLVLAVVVAVLGFAVGSLVGTAAGLAGGRPGRFVLRACDLVQAFPTFLLALAVLAATHTPTRLHIGGVFCLSAWAPFARLSLVQARTLAGAPFIEAARALGASPSRVLLRHLLPNLLAPVAVQMGTTAAGVVLGETSLAFVGLGPHDGVSLGALLEQGTIAMLRAPHVLLVGAIAVATLSGSLQLASEGLRMMVSRERFG